VIALFSGGHALLEGRARHCQNTHGQTLASLTQMTFKRVQFTPDLMPSDVIARRCLRWARASSGWHRGAIFTNVLLGDEINRAPAKTQARCWRMEERQ